MTNAPEYDAMTDCPELESLAAFHDGRLPEADRLRVLEHAASCGECMDILEGLAAAKEANVLQSNVVRGGFGRRGWAGAAAAAVMAGWLILGPLSQRGMHKLVAAAGKLDERPVAARLSADFPYQKHSPERGGDEENVQYAFEADAWDVAANSSSSAKGRHAAGVAFLLLGPKEREQAMNALEEANAKDPNNPAILIDLSAAYHSLGKYKEALEKANQALAIERTPAALWNRALAIEQLRPKQEAIAAWNEYLAVDPSSPWATEAKEKHLRNLQ